MSKTDEAWMRRCFTLARKGIGKVSPNPFVGAVIVKNGKVLGEGYHKYYGGAHAEINAIKNAIRKGYDVYGGTIYINLEPCFHIGKTPPCVDAIISHGLSRVVVGMKDPNPLVSGKSLNKLKKLKIDCSVNILQHEAEALNEKFSKFISTKIPFVALKVAQTSDGFIARSDGSSKWITNKRTRTYVHQLRREYDAIMVGATTVVQDDPELTVRHITGRNPVRVVVDGKLSVPVDRKVFNEKAKTILFTSTRSASLNKNKIVQFQKKHIDVISLPSKNNVVRIKDILTELSKQNISSVIVEGGRHTYEKFIEENIVDKIYLFTGKKEFKDGLKLFDNVKELHTWRILKERTFGKDTLKILYK